MISSTTPFSRQIYFKCHRSISVIALEAYLLWRSPIVDEIYFSSYQKISPQLGKFLGVLNRLDKRGKGAIQAYLVKNNRKKLAKKFGGLKERRTFAPAIEKATMVVER